MIHNTDKTAQTISQPGRELSHSSGKTVFGYDIWRQKPISLLVLLQALSTLCREHDYLFPAGRSRQSDRLHQGHVTKIQEPPGKNLEELIEVRCAEEQPL